MVASSFDVNVSHRRAWISHFSGIKPDVVDRSRTRILRLRREVLIQLSYDDRSRRRLIVAGVQSELTPLRRIATKLNDESLVNDLQFLHRLRLTTEKASGACQAPRTGSSSTLRDNPPMKLFSSSAVVLIDIRLGQADRDRGLNIISRPNAWRPISSSSSKG